MTRYGTLNPYAPKYTGAPVSKTFMNRWRSKRYVGAAAPWGQVSIRRGYMKHSMHNSWPGPNAPSTVVHVTPPPFGSILGLGAPESILLQDVGAPAPQVAQYPIWYPDWTPTSEWVVLPGVSEIDIQESVNYAGGSGGDGSGGAGGSNGLAVATVTVENQAWVATAGRMGAYHVRQRGWLWPWRGWVPTNRPGGNVSDQNEWYDTLPNAQIMIRQGYGEDAAVKTFTGLIDKLGPGSMRPDRITLTARDFGSVLVDVNPFGWNKDTRIKDPMYFVPPNYPGLPSLQGSNTHNWVVVNDATDIVRVILRWCGFKEWEIEDAGVQLKTAYPVDRSSTWMDVINTVASDLGYVFFMAEPSSADLSIGVPVFRKQQVLVPQTAQPIVLDSNMLTDIQPSHDNTNDRHIIRVRGRFATRQQGGRPIVGGDMTTDGQVLFTFQYWPPWMPKMSGIIKQMTYYNIGQNGILGFSSNSECEVACLLIAVQIALGRDTATVQCPGQPAIGLDTMAFVSDSKASGITSRLYVTGKQSTMTIGGDGTSTAPNNNGPGNVNTTMLWSTELTGSLCDNPEWEHILSDYKIAINGGHVVSSGGTGQWD